MNVWMSEQEIKMIEKYITPNSVMLEYGSGGSTLHFSRLVKEYYSIEHNKEWFNKVDQKLQKNPHYTNIKEYKLVKVEKKMIIPGYNDRPPTPWSDLENTERYKLFEAYIKEPSRFGVKFDACLIDGRARPECAKYIYNFMKNGSYVFIHDYWLRKYYHVVEKKYSVVDFIKEGQSLVVLQK